MAKNKVVSMKDTSEVSSEESYYAKHFSAVDSLGEDSSTGVWQTEVKAFMEANTLKSLFFNEDWVFIIVDLLAHEMSNVPLRVMHKEVVDGDVKITPAEGHPLQALIENPNDWQDYTSWIYNIAVERTLMGNAIIWRQKSDNQLIVLPTEKVTMGFDNDGELEKYTLTQDSGDGTGHNLKGVLEFPVDDVLHLKRPNPSSLLYGLSPFVPGRKSILFNRYSQDYLNAFYQKGATPGMAIKIDKSVSENSALRLLKSFEMAYTGRRNQRRTLVLPKGTEAQVITPSIGDQQLPTMISQNMEKIINLLGIPKHALSLNEAGSLGSEEHKQALKYLWTSRLKPQLASIAGSFTQFFKEDLGEDFYFEFDFSNVEVLQDDEVRKAELAKLLKETHTLNEVRAKIYELPSVNGGDQVFLSGGAIPVLPSSSDIEEPAPEVPDVEDIEGAEEPEAIEETEELEESKQLEEPSELKALLDKNDTRAWVQKAIDRGDDEVEEVEATVIRRAINLFGKMAEEAIKIIRRNLKDEKAYTKATDEELDRVRKDLEEAFDKLEGDFVEAQVETLASPMEVGYDLGLDLIFNKEAVAAIQAIRARTSETKARRQILADRNIDTFKNMSETRTERIMQTIENGLVEQRTIQQISRDVAGKIGDPLANIKQGTTIARTETLTAVSIGQKAMMDNTATIIPELKKAWITADDFRVRGRPGGLYSKSEANHWELQDGKAIAHDAKFKNGLRFPRDPKGGPGETINCRCTLVLVAPEDLADLDIPKN